MANQLMTPIEYFYKWEKEIPNRPFLKQPKGDTWKTWTYAEAGQEARRMATALRDLGLPKGSHIGLSSKNCAHWILADMALTMAGYVSVPFYASLTADQLAEVLEKSDCKALFVGKMDHWDKAREEVADKMDVVIRFPHYAGSPKVKVGYDWDRLVEITEPMKDSPVPNLDDVWSILFTSGTTGSPKGVMHTHKNAALIIENEKKHNSLGAFDTPTGEGRFFSFLPLNHIAERAAVEIGALQNGASISFAESLETFGKNLRDTQPTFFFAVPRIWTKFQLGVLSQMPQEKLDAMLANPAAKEKVQAQIKQTLGLTHSKCNLTGASITPEPVKEFFQNLGINLREVYGMTENFGGFTLMPADRNKPNTVGKPMPGTQGKIHPDTGEILMKMDWLMKGYYKDPELTAKTLKDGWLHTGDKGIMDEEGFIKIIGRVKDAFKTTKGKFVVPTTIEAHFSGNDNIEQICVAGLGIPQPMGLVCLSEIGQKADKAAITANLKSELERVNQQLAPHEKLSTMVIANEAWSDANKMLTPTLKIRRGAINEKYMEKMSDWHHAADAVVWE